jgi:type IV pilus assembly protein PilA
MKAIFTAQKAFFQEKDRFSSLTGEVGFEPERNNRYAYFLAGTYTLEDRAASTIAQATTYTGIKVDTFKYGTANSMDVTTFASTGCSGGGTLGVVGNTFVAAAAGNIDADATIDAWSISSDSRVFGGCSADANNPSGEPANEVNDVNL